MIFRLELGRLLRDELEFAGLFAAKKWVLAKGCPSKKKGITPKQAAQAKHIALGKFRRVDWTNKECAQAGDWLIAITHLNDLFVEDGRGGLEIASEVRVAFDEFAEDLVFKQPLYMPSLTEPAPWTSWRTEYDGRISATFVSTNHPKTIEAVKAAFADDSIKPHAMGVSAIQRVPLRINPVTLPLVKQFGGEEYKRDTAVADALLDKTFWSPIRCDFRGRLIHLSDFNYTRGDPVRSLFLFAQGKPIGDSINWLEIAVANAYGVKGTWQDRHKWVADNRELIKAVAADSSLIWLQDTDDRGKPKAKEPSQFTAACAEYVAADTYGRDYETHLPIWLDASSNGLQHLAMMCRDPELAAMVNLNTVPHDKLVIGLKHADGRYELVSFVMDAIELGGEVRLNTRTDEIRDAYEIVAQRAATHLFTDRADPLSQFWLDHKQHLRDLLKQPIMTLPYGVTRAGMLDQINEGVEEINEGAEEPALTLPKGAAVKLRDIAWDSIKEKLPGAMKARERIQAIAKHLLEPGREPFRARNGKIRSRFWAVHVMGHADRLPRIEPLSSQQADASTPSLPWGESDNRRRVHEPGQTGQGARQCCRQLCPFAGCLPSASFGEYRGSRGHHQHHVYS
jgi:hypothetical protein